MNSFGRLYRVSLFGESHGPAVGVLIDGCPAGVPLAEKDFDGDLGRRRAGAKGTTPRTEPDRPELLSGVFRGKTTGAPVLIRFENMAQDSAAYEAIKDTPRPGHADFTGWKKSGGFNDYRGGGHFSGRLTLGLVAAGVLAKKVIRPVTVEARIVEAGGSADIGAAVDSAVEEQDSIGGIVACEARKVPAGLGEPFFDSVESLLSHVIFAIPAVRAIEFGAGFEAARMKGSVHNDPIISPDGKTATNHAGGINGGITNGNSLVFRVAVKPTSSISRLQKTVNLKTGKAAEIAVAGRHDTCIALRVPVVVEAAAAIVLADLMLLEQLVPRVFREKSR
jgi:chorismate synthase